MGKHDAFEVPLQYVSQCNAGKNEVTLEFSLNEEAPVNLAEMRYSNVDNENDNNNDVII